MVEGAKGKLCILECRNDKTRCKVGGRMKAVILKPFGGISHGMGEKHLEKESDATGHDVVRVSNLCSYCSLEFPRTFTLQLIRISAAHQFGEDRQGGRMQADIIAGRKLLFGTSWWSAGNYSPTGCK